jgi:ATP-dependent Clp protease ATP-binding subunit ClpC
VDFKNTTVILTTNLGTSEIGKSLGFGAESNDEKFTAKINNAVKNHLRPELLNRVDEVIIFKPLNEKSIEIILEKFLKELSIKLIDKNISIHLSDNAKKYLINKGVDEKLGARPLRRTVQRELEDKLSNLIISGELENGGSVLVDHSQSDTLTLSVMPSMTEVNVL